MSDLTIDLWSTRIANAVTYGFLYGAGVAVGAASFGSLLPESAPLALASAAAVTVGALAPHVVAAAVQAALHRALAAAPPRTP